MASGDVVMEFTNMQLRDLHVGTPTFVSNRPRTPQEYLMSGGNSFTLPNDESLISAEVALNVVHQGDDLGNVDSVRTAYKSFIDGTKRYKITVTEV